MKKLLLILSAAAATIGAQAAHISPDQALERALGNNGPLRAKSLKAAQLRQVSVEGNNFYVFNRTDNAGFLITSSDDRLRPVLGYADAGTIDPTNLPPDLVWWLSEYDREIAALMPGEEAVAIGEEITVTPETKSSVTDNYAQWSPIAPLMTTKWNQSSPFNDLCPYYNNNSSNGRCVTGCVATALAQVVYYNKYYKGTGSKSYTPSGWSTGQTVSFDYANTSINFSAMKDTYTSSDSGTAAGNAVATLMKACGVGVEMSYGPVESGANSYKLVTALVNHFGYDAAGTRYISRTEMPTDIFEKVIYEELSNKRPVLYGGSSATGGHQFVCDGYDSNGMFHINWGWGGTSDGYFTLTALNPRDQGIGSSEGGYNYWQDIVIATKPGSTNMHTVAPVAGSMTADSSTSFHPQLQVNASLDVEAIYLGIIFEYATGNKAALRFSSVDNTVTTWTWNPYTYTPPTGVSKVYVAYRLSESDDWTIAPAMAGKSNYINVVTLEDGSRVYKNPDEGKAEIRLSDVSPKTFYASTGANLSFNMTNIGDKEFNDALGVCLTDQNGESWYYKMSGTNVAQSTPYSNPSYYTVVPVDQSRKIGFPISSLSAGKYTLTLYTKNGKSVSDDSLEFEVLSGSASGETLTSNWTIVNESEMPELLMKGDGWSYDMRVKSATAGNITYSVYFYEKGTNNVKQSYSLSGGYYSLGTGTYRLSSANEFNITLPFGTYDVQYYIYPYGTSNPTSYVSSQRRTIRVGEQIGNYVLAPDAAGTGASVMGAPTGNVEIPASFTISGKSYAATELAEGLYRYSKDLQSIKLPASIKSIGTYAFDGCSNLKYVVLNNPAPVFDYVQVIAQNSNQNCDWYVPNGSYDAYTSAMGSHNLYEVPSAMTDKTFYLDKGETLKASAPFAIPGHYKYSVADDMASVATADADLNITGVSAGTATVTIATPAPFAASSKITVNVNDPQDVEVANLSELWRHVATADQLPVGETGATRSTCTYVIANDLHAFDRQDDYLMVNDRTYNNDRMHGLKLTGVDATFDHTKTFNAKGRFVTVNGNSALNVTEITAKDETAEPAWMSVPYGTFTPSQDAATWLHTYVRLWYTYYDADTQTLSGFKKDNTTKAIIGDASEVLPIKNLNNATLPSSDRYDPLGYIDQDADGSYYFVPTGDSLGDVSTGISDIAIDGTDANARYFNLQGIEVKAPLTPGVYVRKAGGKTVKVLVK